MFWIIILDKREKEKERKKQKNNRKCELLEKDVGKITRPIRWLWECFVCDAIAIVENEKRKK